MSASEQTPQRPTLKDEAERLLSYWEQHGDNAEVVAKWAITDMLGILRYILEDEAEQAAADKYRYATRLPLTTMGIES